MYLYILLIKHQFSIKAVVYSLFSLTAVLEKAYTYVFGVSHAHVLK